VTFFWNVVHAELLPFFVELAGQKNDEGHIDPTIPTRIWLDQPSDVAQRSILLAFAELKLSQDQEALSLLQWVIQELGHLSTYRNDATHAAFYISSPKKGELRGGSNPATQAVLASRLARL